MSCCLIGFKLIAQVTESIVDVDLTYPSWLSLFKIINKESRCVKDSFVKKWTLNYSLIAFLYELMN